MIPVDMADGWVWLLALVRVCGSFAPVVAVVAFVLILVLSFLLFLSFGFRLDVDEYFESSAESNDV